MGRFFESRSFVEEEGFQRLRKVHQQMKPICGLPSLGSSKPCSFSVGSPTITADEFHTWTLS
jgi:hypothetical protein